MARRLTAFLLFIALASPAAAFAADVDAAGLSPEEKISADDLRKMQIAHENFTLYDARGKREFDNGHIAGATLPLPLKFYNDQELFKAGIIPKAPDAQSSLAQSIRTYPKEARFVTYCNRDCTASARLLKMMKGLGYRNVQAMEEGFQAWDEKGYPVERGQ